MRIYFLILILISIFGCNKGPIGSALSGNDRSAGGDCNKNGATGTITGNHGHVLNVTSDDVLISLAKSYDITGSAGHSHTVDLTIDAFNRLALQVSVDLTSSVGGAHTHSVTVLCQ